MKTLKLETGILITSQDITDEVLSYVAEAKIRRGLLVLTTPSNTCAVLSLSTENEKSEKDVLKHINHLYPVQDGWTFNGYQMNHIRSALIGNTKTFLIEGGELVLGAYERIFFLDFMGPSKERLLVMDALGEKLAADEAAVLPDEILSYNRSVIREKEEKEQEEEKIREELRREREERIRKEKEEKDGKEK